MRSRLEEELMPIATQPTVEITDVSVTFSLKGSGGGWHEENQKAVQGFDSRVFEIASAHNIEDDGGQIMQDGIYRPSADHEATSEFHGSLSNVLAFIQDVQKLMASS